MRLAWKHAAVTNPDYYLLLNDDTEIVTHAVRTLLERTGGPDQLSIAVAAIADPATSAANYGAYKTGTVGLLPCDVSHDSCSAFNGNCVLITSAVVSTVGTFDPAYTHSMADSDYGLRASSAGIDIRQPAGILGFCGSNCKAMTWQDPSVPRLRRLRQSQRPTALPWRDWLHYCRRHHRFPIWARHFISPYIRILLGR
jgi:GT2 family glycosyltransferase